MSISTFVSECCLSKDPSWTIIKDDDYIDLFKTLTFAGESLIDTTDVIIGVSYNPEAGSAEDGFSLNFMDEDYNVIKEVNPLDKNAYFNTDLEDMNSIETVIYVNRREINLLIADINDALGIRFPRITPVIN